MDKEQQKVFDGLNTVEDQIRYLDSLGATRLEIMLGMNVRLQQVYNALQTH